MNDYFERPLGTPRSLAVFVIPVKLLLAFGRKQSDQIQLQLDIFVKKLLQMVWVLKILLKKNLKTLLLGKKMTGILAH